MANGSLKDLYINNIINAKKQWQDYTNAGNTAAAESVAKNASKWYEWLNKNGFGAVATKLSNQDYGAAATDAKSGKVKVRDYSKLIGATTYGLSDDQINSMLSYDNDTGEVTIGGVNVGTPTEIEGSTYMNQEDIESAWEKAANSLGIAKSADIQYGQQMDKFFDAVDNIEDTTNDYHNEYLERNDALNKAALEGNPFDYDWAKSIMGYYNWGGENAANGEMASGAASNGGNVDSFAAANAARQQLAFTNAGKKAVSEDWVQRLGIVQTNLQNLASEQDNKLSHLENANTQRLTGAQTLFDNNETKKNNEFTREQTAKLNDAEILSMKGATTGYIPEEWRENNNPYLNDDGTVAAAYMTDEYDNTGGFMAEINEINEKLKNTDLTDSERQQLIRQRSNLAEARAVKLNQEGYAAWAADDTNRYILPAEQTAEMRSAAADRQNAYDISHDSNQTSLEMNRDNLAYEYYVTNVNDALTRDEWEYQATEAEKERYYQLAKANASKSNSSGSKKSSSSDSGSVEVTDEQVNKAWAELSANGINGLNLKTNAQNMAKAVGIVSEMDFSADEAIAILLKLGFTDEEIEAAMQNPIKK